MAREEEEKEEAMCLTYDRPELVNKVVFRRSKTTGTWEVVMPTPPLIDKQASQTSNPNSIGKNVGRKGKREEVGSSRSRDFKHTALDKREESGKEIEKETGSCGGGTLPSKTAKQRRSNPGSVEVDDPDYSPNKQRHRRTRSNHRSNVTASAITVDSDRSPSLGIKSTPPNHLKGVIVSASPPLTSAGGMTDVMVLRSKSTNTKSPPLFNNLSSLSNHCQTGHSTTRTGSKHSIRNKS